MREPVRFTLGDAERMSVFTPPGPISPKRSPTRNGVRTRVFRTFGHREKFKANGIEKRVFHRLDAICRRRTSGVENEKPSRLDLLICKQNDLPWWRIGENARRKTPNLSLASNKRLYSVSRWRVSFLFDVSLESRARNLPRALCSKITDGLLRPTRSDGFVDVIIVPKSVVAFGDRLETPPPFPRHYPYYQKRFIVFRRYSVCTGRREFFKKKGKKSLCLYNMYFFNTLAIQ